MQLHHFIMSNYRRIKIEGATYFFTVNCAERYNNHILIDHIDSLRQVFRKVKQYHPFKIDAIVILPEHLHCIWTLPENDADYKTRWKLIKAGFSQTIPCREKRSESRISRGERGIWQRRYWEHLIRNEKDFEQHLHYIHWNPVKHGWVENVQDWQYSSFHNYVQQGVYSNDWTMQEEKIFEVGE